MDLNLTPEEARFRDEIRDWLGTNLPDGWEPLFQNRGEDMKSWIHFLKGWQRKLFDNELIGIGWPKEYGGRGATIIEQLILTEELARAGAPELLHIAAGLELVGPALMHHGTADPCASRRGSLRGYGAEGLDQLRWDFGLQHHAGPNRSGRSQTQRDQLSAG